MLRSLLVFAILIPGVFAAVQNRMAALLLYLWFALFRPQDWMWWDISALRPSLVLGLLLVVPCLLTGVFPLLSHPLSVGFLLFLLAGLLGQISAVDPATGWYWLDFVFRLFVVCMLAMSLVSDQRRFKLTLAVIAGSFGFHAAKAGMVSLLGGGVRFYDGFAGAFRDNNGYAVGMAMIAPLLFATAQNLKQPWLRRCFYAAAFLAPVAVVSTFSRGGFLALAAAAMVMAFVQRRRVVAFVAVAMLAIPLVFVMSSQDGYLDRMNTIRTYEETNEESALSRLHFWRVAIAMAADHPLGVGLFNYEAAYDRYDFLDGAFGRRRSVHSSPFQVVAETGFLGTMTYAFLVIYALRCAFRIRRRGAREDLDPDDRRLFVTSANALIVSMTAFLVGGLFVAMALNDLTWMTFALVASLDRISARCVQRAEAVVTRVERAAPQRFAWQPASRAAL